MVLFFFIATGREKTTFSSKLFFYIRFEIVMKMYVL